MSNSGKFAQKWRTFMNLVPMDEVLTEDGNQPKTPWQTTKKVFRIIGLVIYHLRKVFMAIPVVYYAIKLAAYGMANLPETVGLSLQANGTYTQMVSRAVAVNGSLMVTGACLALMFLSRKTVYPWLISIFSLIVPIALLITNIYPC